MASWKDDLLLKISNIIVYFAFLSSNIYALQGPKSGYIDGKVTYLSPAAYAYLVWSVIHALLFGTILYQFYPCAQGLIIKGISWRFTLLAALNALYIGAWTEGNYILAFGLAVCVSSVVTHILYTIKRFHPCENLNDYVLVHLPFSLWHGWTTVLMVVTGFQAFGLDALKEKPGFYTQVSVFLSLAFLEATSVTYAFSTTNGDIPASFVVALSLFAIFTKQEEPFVHWSALGFALLSLFWLGKAVYCTVRPAVGKAAGKARERAGSSDGERRVLLGAHAAHRA